MMFIPKKTQSAIDNAFNEMERSNEKYISYYFRWRIYETIMHVDSFDGQFVFRKLAIVSARYVLPIWQKSFPWNRMPNELIASLEEYLEEPVDRINITRDATDTFWDYVEKLGNTSEALKFENAIYAGETIAEAAMEVLGKIPYKNITLDENDSDINLDVWCGDTAFWAANAFAGRYGTPKADYEKYRLFWMWWLKDAIPYSFRDSKP